MDYIYIGAAALGGGWTGYLIGQFSSVKEMNRRLNYLAAEKRAAQDEAERMADVIAGYQARKPEREANGKFASKKKRVTAELAAYVASKAA
jgi:hypothetical protein